MQEYIAAAMSNLGWVHWREKQYEETKALCIDALRIWQSLPLVSPFQELAIWPLSAVLVQEDQLEQAQQSLSRILDPSQRRLEPELEQRIRAIVDARTPEEITRLFKEASNIVEAQGYL